MRLFDSTHYVTGERFFGRQEEIDYLRSHFFDEVCECRCCNLSLTGMNRIGKTSLVQELCSRFSKEQHPNVHVLYTTLDGKKGFWEYWIPFVLKPLIKRLDFSQFDDNYKAEIEDCCSYFKERNTLKNLVDGDAIENLEARSKLELLFQCLQENDIKTILVIDEFDKAQKVFCGEQDFGWLRGLLSQGDFGISALTISRRSIYEIEVNTFGGSTLHGIFNKISLYGFTNSDIDEYFRRLASCVGDLPEGQKKKIWQFCGRSPYYLAIVGEELTRAKSITRVNVEKVAKDCLRDSFDAVVRLLEAEKLLKPMLQMFVKPERKLTPSDIDKLISLGYCVRVSALENACDPGEYKDYFPDIITCDKSGKYATICRQFVSHLADISRSRLDELDQTLKATQQYLRTIIEYEYSHYYPDDWKEIIWGDLQANNESSLAKYMEMHDEAFQQADDEGQQKVGNSILNVVSINQLGRIMKNRWVPWFRSYFPNLAAEDFVAKCDVLTKARNSIAHGNGELLTIEDRDKSNAICKDFIRSIKKRVKEEG